MSDLENPDVERQAANVLQQLWHLLPAFAAVASSEHLPTAAKKAHLTVSTLSRSISALHAVLGRPLFERRGRQLRLNVQGEHLLLALTKNEASLREAVRELLVSPNPRATTGRRVRVAAMGQLLRTHVLPALAERQDTQIVIESPSTDTALDKVRRGALDLFVAYGMPAMDDVESTLLSPSPIGIYFGPSSPLFVLPRLSNKRLMQEAFVVPPALPKSLPSVWPVTVPRRIGLEVPDAQSALDACLHGPWLMAMSKESAAPYVHAGRLRGVHAEFITPPEIRAFTSPHAPPSIRDLVRRMAARRS